MAGVCVPVRNHTDVAQLLSPRPVESPTWNSTSAQRCDWGRFTAWRSSGKSRRRCSTWPSRSGQTTSHVFSSSGRFSGSMAASVLLESLEMVFSFAPRGVSVVCWSLSPNDKTTRSTLCLRWEQSVDKPIAWPKQNHSTNRFCQWNRGTFLLRVPWRSCVPRAGSMRRRKCSIASVSRPRHRAMNCCMSSVCSCSTKSEISPWRQKHFAKHFRWRVCRSTRRV
mmetsp:Transcript_53428/g.125662  ORF Transcript_53428/g.125662 Transcript_53428/m.125662 type:complete len:223 (-) Transcript_53428:217-885(-)